ncbi:MAG: AbrB/MazE/SpoVT family DNA-binding domain-containing protein, partial [Bacillota bacterium]|nr:AbrB/MazE/SpoVT family DNA-binding domain-containing protein [Bacillota bacterium]
MNNARLNERGQITIPKKIREQTDIGPNDHVTIKVNDQGQIVIAKRDFFDDLNDLIRRDLVSEGVASYE